MIDRNPSNELLELLKNQSRSAKDWSYSIAGAFWQNKGQIVDGEYLFTCLANAMMSMHDSIFNKEIKQLEQELQKTRVQLDKEIDKVSELALKNSYLESMVPKLNEKMLIHIKDPMPQCFRCGYVRKEFETDYKDKQGEG